MLHRPSDRSEVCLKQVELNSFSCAGACHTDRVAGMHRHLARVRDVIRGRDPPSAERLPENKNTEAIVALLKAAHDTYNSTASSTRRKCVLMVVQPVNFNIADRTTD